MGDADLTTAAIIVAAGRGTRLAAEANGPKQYVELEGQALLARTVLVFAESALCETVQVVIHADDQPLYERAMRPFAQGTPGLAAPVFGGATRQASVLAGLEALAAEVDAPDVVLIHDAARPFVKADDLAHLIDAASQTGAAIAATPVVDTLKAEAPQKTEASSPTIAKTIPRDGLWRALTPQAFRFPDILSVHRAAAAAGVDMTDDAALYEWAGRPVALVATDPGNFKITTPQDLKMAAERIASAAAAGIPDIRTGTGFDVHRFAEGSSVWLCGVEIPHTARLDGHSDADVGLHALTDAILGAIGDGDIGAHFPPSDPQWKGAASDQFLADAVRRVTDRGGRILNVDVTLLCEAPKIGPHRDAMRARMAEILRIAVDRVGVKATTTEQLGFTGRREGIAAMASATVYLGQVEA
jgi:2-C-methyl-D-erythritol 4-phosphate cytidylyltransferase/2-C-methyl-D-erythritol 2,4-cyclodiphosphate synthase